MNADRDERCGVVIVDKPSGMTSFDVVARMRRIYGTRRVGHTGTLDPQATGVLVVLIGRAAKAAEYISAGRKIYEATLRLGVETDTEDIWGTPISTSDSIPSADEVAEAASAFVGDIMQVPPMYSAVSKNGVRLYELARKGIETEREARPITVHSLELLSFDEQNQCGKLKIMCSKGTYVRVICDDIGKLLGCGCVLTSLRRTYACGYTLENAVDIDTLRRLSAEGGIEKYIKSVDSIFREYDSVNVTEKQAVRFNNGGALSLSLLNGLKSEDDGVLYRVYGGNTFLGLGVVNSEKGELAVKKRFVSE